MSPRTLTGRLPWRPFRTRYLIQPEETQVTDHAERADSRSRGDLACHLQADLYDLQRVGKDDLRASSLVRKRIWIKTRRSKNVYYPKPGYKIKFFLLTQPPAMISAKKGIVLSFVVNLSLTKSFTCEPRTQY